MGFKTQFTFDDEFDARQIKQAKLFCGIIIDENIDIAVGPMIPSCPRTIKE